ncbi:hypothetical protein PCANC_20746 [Puccinia coronata f. sp. avenae]|uniref:Uncharacterized protein n=1 Tax=Puccinia coronata f. sp. avenae TaxID=200324 RepID=A0A2N5U6Q1_9BASI|nr:hypothetical protein PCANC_20746 [Puccinia coronata f. sp. avenae]
MEVFERLKGLDSGTPEGRAHTQKNSVQPLHAALERRAEAARPSPQAARHSHTFNRRATLPDRRAEPARLSGGRAKPARPSDRRAGFARLLAHLQLRGSRKPLELRGLREPAQASSAGTDLGAGTETRHQPPRSASKRPATPNDYSTDPPLQ